MRAHRVEVAQHAQAPGRVRHLQGGQDVFNHQLGVAIGVGVLAREILGDRHRGRIAINRGAAGKHQRAAARSLHRLKQADGAADVVAVVLQRLGDALADGLVTGKVHHADYRVAAQHILNPGRVKHIAALAGHSLAGDLLQALQHSRMAVGEIVQNHRRKTRRHQRQAGVAADIARAAG